MEFDLMVEFDRDETMFARGVEIGLLWETLRSESLPVHGLIHADNMEMAIRLADARGVSVRADDSDDDWLYVTYY